MSYIQLSCEKHLTATQTSYVVAGAPIKITDIKLTCTAQGADNSDNYEFVISVGGTTVASRQNNVAGGPYVADAVETLTISNSDKLSLAAGDVIKVVATKGGSATALSARVDFIGELSRDFS